MSGPDHRGHRAPQGPDRSRLHLRFGFWTLFVFLTLGLVLETLHGFKVDWYVGVASQTRRLMFTLAHAHGTLLGLVHIAFGLALGAHGTDSRPWLRIASPCLFAAGVLLPGGFLLGGIVIYAGDPGLGILLVPLGALCAMVAIFLAARHLG